KSLTSLYGGAVPPVGGRMELWRFRSGLAEARSIAASCRDLIAGGVNPREILVLLSNARALLPAISTELTSIGVPFEPPRSQGLADTSAGRLVLALVRIASDSDDHVAHRVLLGSQRGVGIKTCSAIAVAALIANLNYRD